jgi:hypothetical protein
MYSRDMDSNLGRAATSIPQLECRSRPGNASLSAEDRQRNDYIAWQMVPFRRRSASITDALDYEIAQEQAAALGRAGRALEAAPETGRTVFADAGDALWRFIIQRECCGLRDPRAVMRDYRVPQEVQNCMGIFRARDRRAR